jgi:hypothetical protein
MKETEYHGGCLCGAVCYSAAGPASNATLCHCETCRRAAGAPVVAWLTFAARGFAFTRGDPVRYRSSPLVIRTFCGRCGTSLSYARDDEPETIDVTMISLERAAELAPCDHTWTSDGLPWMRGLDALPRFSEKRSHARE